MQACNAQIGSKKIKFWLEKKTFVKIKTTKKCCNFMKFLKYFEISQNCNMNYLFLESKIHVTISRNF